MLRHENPLVLIVDHALRETSKQDVEMARDFAQNLGLDVRTLTWCHANPITGVQEKARQARYGLMGEVCRRESITCLLTGHTKDDQAETLLMRYDRGTNWRGAVGMSEKIYAPVWPGLAGITIVRPFLGCGRAELRQYNRDNKLTWSEDPSNKNEDFSRIKARSYLQNRPHIKSILLDAAHELCDGLVQERVQSAKALKRHVSVDEWGIIRFECELPLALLRACLLAASGQNSPISWSSAKKLRNEMMSSDFQAATLGGACVIRRKGIYMVGRDPVIAKGRRNQVAAAPLHLSSKQTDIWDGRFEIKNLGPDIVINPMSSGECPENALAVPYILRQSLPMVMPNHGRVLIKSLVAPRLHGLLGAEPKAI